MSFRILNQAPQYLLPNGKPNAGGKFFYFDTDLSTPRDTWSDEDLSTLNPNPVPLDASGRTQYDVWGDGEYGVVMKDALGVTIWTRNNVRDAANPGAVIPALEDGKFLTNDGSVMSWAGINQVPDATGTDGNMLYSDGANAYWGPPPVIPEPPEPDIVVGADSLTVGDGGANKFVIQTGKDTAPSSGSRTTSKNVTFPTPFAKILGVFVQSNTNVVGAYGIGATCAASGYSVGSASTGFTANFNSADDGGGSGYPIVNAVNFNWIAFGLVAAE